MDVARWKQRVREARPGEEGALLARLATEVDRERTAGTPQATEYQLLWLLLSLARRAGELSRFPGELDRALELAADRPGEELLALAGLRADRLLDEGKLEAAEDTLRAALGKAGGLEPRRKGALLLKLAHLLIRRERYDAAATLLGDLLPVFERDGLAALAATCRFHLGNLALWRQHLELASERHRAALDTRRELGEARGICASLSALGAVALRAGNYPRALERFHEAEEAARAAGDDRDLAYALLGLGRTLSRLGDPAGAAPRLRAALEIRRRSADVEGVAVARLALAGNELDLGHADAALELAKEATFHLQLSAPSPLVGDAERLLGRIHLMRKRGVEARRHFAKALALHEARGDAAAAAFDRSWLLRMALDVPVRQEIEPLVEAIRGFLAGHPYPELGERLDLAVFQGLEALAGLGIASDAVRGRRRHLERAHETLMRKTGYLGAALRGRFLLQVPDNDAILRSADAAGLDAAVPAPADR